MAIRLNLGCGEFKKKGYINIDFNHSCNPDVVHDLNSLPYPFDNNQFELIEADHVLEHLDNPFKIMKELHRILKPGGKIIIKVPHFSRGFTHPEHKRGFDVTFPYYFDSRFKGGYQGVEFKLNKVELLWLAQPYLKKTILSKPVFYIAAAFSCVISGLANILPFLCSRIWCYWVGGFEEIKFILEK